MLKWWQHVFRQQYYSATTGIDYLAIRAYKCMNGYKKRGRSSQIGYFPNLFFVDYGFWALPLFLTSNLDPRWNFLPRISFKGIVIRSWLEQPISCGVSLAAVCGVDGSDITVCRVAMQIKIAPLPPRTTQYRTGFASVHLAFSLILLSNNQLLI